MLIEGDNGNIIIDILESRESAMEVKKDFQVISSKPIVAIIYTHNHADHVFGAQVFAEDNLENIKIYAHAKTMKIINEQSYVQQITFQRAARQFRTFLTKDVGHINDGIGLSLNYNQNNTRGFLPPTDTFTGSKQLTIAGREFILYHAPGKPMIKLLFICRKNAFFSLQIISTNHFRMSMQFEEHRHEMLNNGFHHWI
jgi:alkyl sulfatase BDS1-like metallo-beta-lactamase superfamily hydrolase